MIFSTHFLSSAFCTQHTNSESSRFVSIPVKTAETSNERHRYLPLRPEVAFPLKEERREHYLHIGAEGDVDERSWRPTGNQPRPLKSAVNTARMFRKTLLIQYT
jgi:hypothetical protein